MRKCYRCKTLKELSAFCKNSREKDGLNRKCKECSKKDLSIYRKNHPDKAREIQLKWERGHPNLMKAKRKRSYLKHRKERLIYRKGYSTKYPERIKANRLAQGYIPLKKSCEKCGGEAKARHHPDYSQPLGVIHLCASCHKLIHKKGGSSE
jgi:hypothetical protein